MKQIEKTLKAFANRRRLAILRYLRVAGEANVGDIAGAIRLSFRSTSRHLAILSAADILEKEQRSLEMFYKISPSLDATGRSIIKIL